MEARKLDHRYTVEEYLAYDASIAGRAEYHDGYIVDMAGGSKPHSQIAFNIALAIQMALGTDECNAYIADVKLRAEKANCYFYPDLWMECGDDKSEESAPQEDRPCLIVEVPSESTFREDLVVKFFAYQQIPTLQDYILVDQNSPRVSHLHRNEAGDWIVKSYYGLGSKLDLISMRVSISLSQIYRLIRFQDGKKPLLPQQD